MHDNNNKNSINGYGDDDDAGIADSDGGEDSNDDNHEPISLQAVLVDL